jgi:AcrR family transcriptional regulator
MQAPDPPPRPQTPTPTRKPGRPPSIAARRKVLEVAHRILVEEGLGRLSIERVAERAGVGKPTIYRTWANAHDLAMAAFMAAPSQPLEAPRARSARRGLIAHLESVVATFDSARGRQVTMTMAAADPNSELAKAFRNQVMMQSRRIGEVLIERGVRSGELRPPADLGTALDMIYGPIFYRLLAGHARVDKGFVENLVDTLIRGLEGSSDGP